MKKIYCVLFAFVCISCKDSAVNMQDQSQNNTLFEIERVNMAWGWVYQGVSIDQDGNSYAYNVDAESSPILTHADGYYTPEELTAKYQHHRIFLRKVSGDTLKTILYLAQLINAEDFSDTIRVGADMGGTTYSIYHYRSQVAKYQKIQLRVDGDYSFYNKSENAIALANLLKNF
jgi:hypothetical protein